MIALQDILEYCYQQFVVCDHAYLMGKAVVEEIFKAMLYA